MTTIFSHALKLEEDLERRKEIAPENWLKERLKEAKARLKVLSTKANGTHDDDAMKLIFMLPAEEKSQLMKQLKKPNGFKEVKTLLSPIYSCILFNFEGYVSLQIVNFLFKIDAKKAECGDEPDGKVSCHQFNNCNET